MSNQGKDEPVLNILMKLAEDDNRLKNSMLDMMGKTNEMAASRTASAEVRTTLAREIQDFCHLCFGKLNGDFHDFHLQESDSKDSRAALAAHPLQRMSGQGSARSLPLYFFGKQTA